MRVALRLDPTAAELSLEVGDSDPRAPRAAAAPAAAQVLDPDTDSGTGGAGLLIVTALCDRITVHTHARGKTVTAILAAGGSGS